MGDTGRLKQAHVAQWLETSRHYLFSAGEPALEQATSSGVESNPHANGQSRQDEVDPLQSDPDASGGTLLRAWLDPRRARTDFAARFFDGPMQGAPLSRLCFPT